MLHLVVKKLKLDFSGLNLNAIVLTPLQYMV